MKQTNPVIYFEIPVNDMERAISFYEAVFGFDFEREEMDSYDMAFFPFATEHSGITGALAKGDVYKPTQNGAILYFHTDNIDQTLEKVSRLGSKTLYPKTINEENGFWIAEFEDSEGNRIAVREIIENKS